MEVVEINSEVLSRSPLIYVNCLDLDSQTYIKLSNLACCLRLPGLSMWYSFNLPKQLEDESEDRRRSVIIIFDFDCVENRSLAASDIQPYDEYEGHNNIPEMLWLDLQVSNCNIAVATRRKEKSPRKASLLKKWQATRVTKRNKENTPSQDTNLNSGANLYTDVLKGAFLQVAKDIHRSKADRVIHQSRKEVKILAPI